MAISRKEQLKTLDRLLSKQESRIREAFDGYVLNTLNDDVLSQLVDAVMMNNIDLALEILRPHVLAMSNVLPVVYTDAGIDMAKEIGEILPILVASTLSVPIRIPEAVSTQPEQGVSPLPERRAPARRSNQTASVSVGFDPTHPRAVEQMRAAKLDLIQQITQSQREMIRGVMEQSFQEGFGPRKAAQLLKESIGLTSRQQEAVRNFRNLLEARDPAALQRKLRDRRFDSAIEDAIRTKKPLSPKQIDNMVRQYHKNSLRHRAETIARTEGLRATNQARMEAIRQSIDELGLEESSIKRKWNFTHDSRVRSFHASMQESVVSMDEPFVDGKGNKLMYPGDPSAPPETTVNCRCMVTISQSS